MKQSRIPIIKAFYAAEFQIRLEDIPMKYWLAVYWHYLKHLIK